MPWFISTAIKTWSVCSHLAAWSCEASQHSTIRRRFALPLALLLTVGSLRLCAATLTLAWDDSQTGILGWRLYRATNAGPFALVTTVATKTATVERIESATNQWYVTAFNGAGESDRSNIVTVNPTVTSPPTNPPPATVPPAPTGLRAQQISGTRLDLGWNSSPGASTEVEISIEGEPFTRIATVSPGTLHYTVQIRRKYDYRFRVKSVNAYGVSPYSNEIFVSYR